MTNDTGTREQRSSEIAARRCHGPAIIMAIAGICCSIASIAAWDEYARYATRAMRAVFLRLPKEHAYHLALAAGWFSLASLLMSVTGIGLAAAALSQRRGSILALWLGRAGIVLGVFAFALCFLLV